MLRGGVFPCFVVKDKDTKEEEDEWIRMALEGVEQVKLVSSTSTHTGGFNQSY
jgi:hypothetical protein